MQELNLEYIMKRRKELGISQLEMAEKLGFKTSSSYLKYEKGIYAFKADQLPALAKALNCKITDFFTKNVAKTAINKVKQLV